MTIQRFPSLSHWGAFTALVEDGRVIGCEPFARDPAPSPMLDAIPEMTHSRLRIARPAIRVGWTPGKPNTAPRTGHDAFREVSWDEALDLVASEIARVRKDHGDAAVFGGSQGWSSAGRLHHARTLVRRFLFLGGGCVDQVGNYSWGAARFLLPHVVGSFSSLTGKVTDWQSIVDNAKLFIAFGGLALRNGQVTSGGTGGHTMGAWLKRAKDAGIDFVVVSPVRSDAPDWLNAQWVPIRPNTDAALMLGMAHTLLSEGLHSKDFLASHCEGFAPFADYLTGKADGEAKSAAWAEAITGVPADTIRDLARRAAAARTMLSTSWSLQRAHHGEQPFWATIALAAMLGDIGLPGGGFAFGHGSMNGVGHPRPDIPSPEAALPPNRVTNHIPASRISDMLLDPGGEYEFNGKRANFPDVKLVYWAGGNPFHHHQDLNRLRRGWQKPDTIIVQDSWWNPATRHADIVLPATTTLERNDIGASGRDMYVFAMHQAVEPQGEARSDFDIFRELSRRMGFEQAFTQGRDEMAWCRTLYDDARDGAAKKGFDLPSFQQLWGEGFVALPDAKTRFVMMEAFRADPAANPLKTPSGKIEITSETIGSYGYDDCPKHPAWLPPAEWLGSAEAARFPLHLVTHQPPRRLHSQMDPGPVSRAGKIQGREPIHLNPDDAASRGLTDGDIVRVFNDRGACLAGVVIDDGVTPRVAMMATGAWYDPALRDGDPEVHGNPNVLTMDVGTSRLTQGPSALSALVEIEKWTAPLPPVRALDPPELV